MIIRIFPHLPITKRQPEQPLGKGKSAVSYWAIPVKPGTIIFELKASSQDEARKVLKAASMKFPMKSKIAI